MPQGRRVAVTAIAFCCLVAFLDGADTQSFAIAAPVIARELSIAPAQMGVIFSIGTLGIAVGAIICGPLADKLGSKTMLALSALCFGAFQLATSYADTFTALLILRTVAGLGLGGAAPCFLALAAAHVSPDRRATALSLLWACFPLGALVGGIANGWILENLGWRAVSFIGGVIPIVVAILLLALVPDARPSNPAEPSFASGVRNRGAATWWRDAALRSRLLLLWCVFFGSFGTLAGLVVWMPTVLVGAGLSPSLGGLILSWHAIGGLLSMATAGAVVTRFGPKVLAIGLLVGAIVLAGTAWAIPSFNLVAAGMVGLGLLLGVAASGSIAVVGGLLPAEGRSSGLGWSMGIGRVGQVILPFLMGLGLDRFGPAIVFALLAIVPAAMAVAAWRFVVLNASHQNP